MKQAVQFVLRGYKRFISPMLPHACRFVPTCSEYAHGSHRASRRDSRKCARRWTLATLPSVCPRRIRSSTDKSEDGTGWEPRTWCHRPLRWA